MKTNAMYWIEYNLYAYLRENFKEIPGLRLGTALRYAREPSRLWQSPFSVFKGYFGGNLWKAFHLGNAPKS